jgi:hypothetical protein
MDFDFRKILADRYQKIAANRWICKSYAPWFDPYWHTLAPGCLTAEGAGATIPRCCPFIVNARATQLQARALRG